VLRVTGDQDIVRQIECPLRSLAEERDDINRERAEVAMIGRSNRTTWGADGTGIRHPVKSRPHANGFQVRCH
jgi:hypothetical protein